MSLAEEIVALLSEKKYKLTTAESCTGGMIASELVNVAGISEFYEEGYITYANHAKSKLLGVDEEILRTKGAVSREVAHMMAEGAAKAAGADVSVAVTGIAGPGGGTKEKPVGLVYIGCCVCGEVTVSENHFDGDRFTIRGKTTEKALEQLLDCIRKQM